MLPQLHGVNNLIIVGSNVPHQILVLRIFPKQPFHLTCNKNSHSIGFIAPILSLRQKCLKLAVRCIIMDEFFLFSLYKKQVFPRVSTGNFPSIINEYINYKQRVKNGNGYSNFNAPNGSVSRGFILGRILRGYLDASSIVLALNMLMIQLF